MNNNTLFVAMLLSVGIMMGLISYQPQTFAQSSDCDPSYTDTCIPPYPPDLNCSDVSSKNFAVISSDPHGFDRDRDGKGCES